MFPRKEHVVEYSWVVNELPIAAIILHSQTAPETETELVIKFDIFSCRPFTCLDKASTKLVGQSS